MPDTATASLSTAERLVQRLEDAWNAGDGAAYGAVFTADADFVTIRGELHSGPAIGAGHQAIFRTVYKDSTVRYAVSQVRDLPGGLVLAHVRATLDVPDGPLAGRHEALATALIVAEDGEPRITAFHNTLIAPPPER